MSDITTMVVAGNLAGLRGLLRALETQAVAINESCEHTDRVTFYHPSGSQFTVSHIGDDLTVCSMSPEYDINQWEWLDARSELTELMNRKGFI